MSEIDNHALSKDSEAMIGIACDLLGQSKDELDNWISWLTNEYETGGWWTRKKIEGLRDQFRNWSPNERMTHFHRALNFAQDATTKRRFHSWKLQVSIMLEYWASDFPTYPGTNSFECNIGYASYTVDCAPYAQGEVARRPSKNDELRQPKSELFGGSGEIDYLDVPFFLRTPDPEVQKKVASLDPVLRAIYIELARRLFLERFVGNLREFREVISNEYEMYGGDSADNEMAVKLRTLDGAVKGLQSLEELKPFYHEALSLVRQESGAT